MATRYEADNGDIHRLRLSDERAAVAGAPPTGPVTNNIVPKISKTNREFGLRPRGVRLSQEQELVAGGSVNKYTFLPVLTQAAYNSAGFAPGTTITIDGEDWEIIAKQPEDF